MAGTVIATGVLGCAGLLALGLVTAGGADVASRRAAASADAAALAAADTASGVVPADGETGDPCARAARVAAASGSRLADCNLDGLIATVSVTVPFGPLQASARARAGPPAAP